MSSLESSENSDVSDIEVELLVEALLRRYQYDFRHYSRSSLKRRISKAAEHLHCGTVSQLQERVLHDATTLGVVIDHLTVPTTELFRDPAYFRALRERVLPYLKTYPSLKVWIAGCSTGEEVYSLAVVFAEEGLLERTIFYATDINPASLSVARKGVYTTESVREASAKYQRSGGNRSLADYCQAAYGAVRFDRYLSENVVFSDHSLATDAVFAEVQLISCRNVLIYFDRALQDRAVGLFDNALVRNGFLGLGSRESLHFSAHRHAFEPINQDVRIFQKR